MALWDTYPNKDGERRAVAIRFNRNSLIQLVENNQPQNDIFPHSTKWIHGRIRYKNLLNVNLDALNKSIVKYTAFRKEWAFRYEKEYRFVINLNEPTSKEGILYKLGKIEEIPFHIFVNPLLEKEEYNSIRKVINDLGFRTNLRTSLLARWFKPEIWPTTKHEKFR